MIIPLSVGSNPHLMRYSPHCLIHLFMTIKTVQSHALDLTLISKDALFDDMRNRTKLHNYEVGEAIKDLKGMVAWTRTKLTNNKS